MLQCTNCPTNTRITITCETCRLNFCNNCIQRSSCYICLRIPSATMDYLLSLNYAHLRNYLLSKSIRVGEGHDKKALCIRILAENNKENVISTRQQQHCEISSLSDIRSIVDIWRLSIKQVKSLLDKHGVNYQGCVEKDELVKMLINLYESSQKATSAPAEAAAKPAQVTTDYEQDICKICLELPIDCALLHCGHMCSCRKCAKQLMTCPICRKNIYQIINVYKS